MAEEHGHSGFVVRDVRHADTPDFAKRLGQILEALALPVQHVVMVSENQMTVIARTAQAFDMHDGLLKTPSASAA